MSVASSHLFAQSLVGDSISKQRPAKIKKMINQSMEYDDWYTTIELSHIYLEKKPNATDVRYNLAKTYHKARNYRQAIEQFDLVLKADSNDWVDSWLFRAQCLKSVGEYEKAVESLGLFKKRMKYTSGNRRFYTKVHRAELASMVLVDSLLVHRWPIVSEPITVLNGLQSESSPTFMNDSTLIYSTYEDDQLAVINVKDSGFAFPKMQLFKTTLSDGHWSEPHRMKDEINLPDVHVGNPVVAPDRKYMFYTICKDNWKGDNICNIYQSRRVNQTWKRPEKLKFGINSNTASSTHPALGIEPIKNRYILYFVSDRKGGKGGKDIWYSMYNKYEDKWSKPRNCGGRINSVADEETPFYDQEKGTLYFSSSGKGGFGGMDVFKAYGARSKWSQADILGMPINSGADDVFYRAQVRDKYFFLVSNRDTSSTYWNETCCDNLYELHYVEDVNFTLRVLTYKEPKDSLNPREIIPDVRFTVYDYDLKTNEKFLVMTDTSDGSIDFDLEPGRTYYLEVEKDGFFKGSKIVSTQTVQINDTLETEIGMKQWDEKPIRIPNIYFEFDSDELTPDSKIALDTSLYALLIENERLIIEIMAHTDNKGTVSYNKTLSQKRAESVMKYLVKKDIDRSRMKAKGYGEKQPIEPNEHPDGSDNPEGRAMNRRVEFRVVGTQMDIRSTR